MSCKYILLDIGNVIAKFDLAMIIDKISKESNKSKDDVLAFLKRVNKFQDIGLSTMKEDLISFGVNDLYSVLDVWDNCLFPNNKVINFLNKIAKDYYFKYVLVSNIGHEHSLRIRKLLIEHGFNYDNVYLEYFSCHVGARKPTFIYFNNLLTRYPELEFSLYVDDLDENLIGAKYFNISTYKFDLNLEQDLDKELEKLMNEIYKTYGVL